MSNGVNLAQSMPTSKLFYQHTVLYGFIFYFHEISENLSGQKHHILLPFNDSYFDFLKYPNKT